MPIFEYVCEDCRQPFEKLIQRDEKVQCPGCQGEHVLKIFSRFGMGGNSSSGPYESLPQYKGGGGCGCTPSTCGCKN
jgi:putative FmdB family regulatory protein